MKLRFKKDTEFIFRDMNDTFNHSKMTIKKNTIIDVDDYESEILENYPQVEFNRFYHITFTPYKYKKEDVIIEILQESENDFNDVDELRSEDCFIYINADDVEELNVDELLKILYELYQNTTDSELREIGDMPFDEFCKFEKDLFDSDIDFDNEVEYYTWVINNFGAWCSPM